MLIFSRSRSPWIAAAFVAVLAAGAYMRFAADSENEAVQLEKDRKSYVVFKEDAARISLPQKVLDSRTMFEFYRCGVRSITEKTYCERIAENFFSELSLEEKEKLRPLLEKHFNLK